MLPRPSGTRRMPKPVEDPLKGKGKVAGFGRTSKTERAEQRAVAEMVKRQPPEAIDGLPR